MTLEELRDWVREWMQPQPRDSILPVLDEAIRERDVLMDALKEFTTQHHCGCGHPACNDCARDKLAADAIAKATGDDA